MRFIPSEMPRRLLTLVGTVIGLVGLITLPDDIDVWRHRIGDVWDMVNDNPLAGIAIVVGIAVVVWANWPSVVCIFRKSKRWKSDAALGSELFDWLRGAGMKPVDVEERDPKDPPLSFYYVAVSSGRPVNILKVTSDPGVQLQVAVKAADEQETVVKNMSPDELDALKEDLGIELARYGLGFDITDIKNKGAKMLLGILLNDKMTAVQFLERVGFIDRATLLAQLVFTRHIRQAQKNAALAVTPVPQSSSDIATSQVVASAEAGNP